MRKELFAVAALGLVPLALAQAPTVSPTQGNGPDAYAKGQDQAAVNQTVELSLPCTWT
mgnify:FL=1